MVEDSAKSEEEAPRFWRTWKRLYATLLVYWAVVLVFLILATRLFNS